MIIALLLFAFAWALVGASLVLLVQRVFGASAWQWLAQREREIEWTNGYRAGREDKKIARRRAA